MNCCHHNQHRLLYVGFVVLTITAGLASRHAAITTYLPSFISQYAGDTLWAMMVYWGFACLLITKQRLSIAIIALIFAFSIEVSQLYQADWINQLRHYRLGALILGYGFKFSDLLCYTLSVASAYCIDGYLRNVLFKSTSHS